MAINLYSSIGTPTANSYVSLASANSYFSARENAEPWNDISNATSNATAADDKKKRLLTQATRELDKTYRYYGSKANNGLRGSSDYQNLEFPRYNDVDVDGNEIIIDDVKTSTYEQALWILNRTSQKKTEDGTIINRQFIGPETFIYISPYIERTVERVGMYPRPTRF